MTLMDALHRIDSIKPNSYNQDVKIAWLSTLDGIIKTEIIDTHEGADNVVFNGYKDDTDLNTILLVPAPYDEIYLFWLEQSGMMLNYLQFVCPKQTMSLSFALYPDFFRLRL